ncbi:UNVERIFIED_ORG: hypothetical protein J2W87_005560 [Pseudomonas putida]|nr:hypothetical protein [Pseudomonas putida]
MAGNRNSGEMATGPLYFCYGAEHEFTLKAEADSPWINQGVSLNRNPAEPALPVTTTPAIASYQTFDEQGATWTVDCPTQPANVPVKAFQLWAQTEFTSPAYKVDVSLGHHRIDFVEASGNEQFQVIEYGEETTLKAREVSYYTKQAMPFAAKWKLGEQDLQAADPDASGWVTPYNFKPSTEGRHLINVTVPSLYYEQGYFRKELPVHALAVTPWGKDAVLQVNRKDESDVVDRGVVCPRGSLMMVSLLNENLLLKDSMVSLKSADAKALGIIFTPDLETEWSMEGGSHYWNLAITGAKSGLFKLQMHCSKLKRDWDIIGHVLSKELKDEKKSIEVNGVEISDFGAVFFREETRTLTVTFAESMRGLYVSLDETGSPGMTYDPPLKRPLKVPENLKLEWQVTGGDRSSVFELQVICADVETPLTIESRVMSKITTDEIESLKVNGEPVDLTQPEFLFFRAGNYTIELIPKPESSLIGLDVALKKGSGGELGMIYDPPLEEPHPLTEAGLKWTVTGGATQSGLFELLIDVPQVEQSMPVTCRLLSTNLDDEVEVWIGGKDATSGGGVLFRGQPGTVKLEPKPGSPIAGYPIALKRTATSPLLPTDLSSSPAFDDPGTSHEWSVTGLNNKSGYFQLQIVAQGMTTFNVTGNKLLSTKLDDEVEVWIGGKDATSGGGVLFRGQPGTVKLEPKPGSPIAGYPIALKRTATSPLLPTDLSSEPVFDVPGTSHEWRVTGANNKSGYFQLQIVAQGMTTFNVTGNKLLSTKLDDEVKVWIGGKDATSGGGVLFRGQPGTVKLEPKPGSPIEGYPIALKRTATSPLLPTDLSSEPVFDVPGTSHEWRVTGANNKSGYFQLQIVAQGMTTFNVTANKLLSTKLDDEVKVWIGGKDATSGGGVLFRGQPGTVKLEPKPGSPIAGYPIALKRTATSPLLPTDLSSSPRFDDVGTTHEWNVTGLNNKSGYFQLQIVAQGMTTFNVTANRLLSTKLDDEVKVWIGGKDATSGGGVLFRGQPGTVKLEPKPGSPIAGYPIALKRTATSPLLPTDLRSSPVFDDVGTTHEWNVTGLNNKSGYFQLQIVAQGMTTFNVTGNKLLSTKLTDEVKVLIRGKDATSGGGVLFRGQPGIVKLEPKPGSPIAGYPIALKRTATSPLLPTSFSSSPPFDDPDSTHEWRVTGPSNISGYFQLQIVAQGMTTINVTDNKLLSTDLRDEADARIGGVPIYNRASWFYRDIPQTVTLTPKTVSPLAGLPVSLICNVKTGLDSTNVVSDPEFRKEGTTYSWKVTGNTKSGTFQLILAGQGMTIPITLAISTLLSRNLDDEVTVLQNGAPIPPNGTNFIGGEGYDLTLRYRQPDLVIGAPLALAVVNQDGVEEREFSCVPTRLGHSTTDHRWELTGPRNKNAIFSLKLFSESGGGMLVTPRNRLGNEHFRFMQSGANLPLPPDIFDFQVNKEFDVYVELTKKDWTPIAGQTVYFHVPGHEESIRVETNSQGRASVPYTNTTPGLRRIRAIVNISDGHSEVSLAVNFI